MSINKSLNAKALPSLSSPPKALHIQSKASDASDAPSTVSNVTAQDPNSYSLYLLLCKGNVIYTGITNDVARRYQQHLSGKGAKFTRSHPPEALLCHTQVGSRSSALKLEYAVKQLPRGKKLAFVQGLKDLPTTPEIELDEPTF